MLEFLIYLNHYSSTVNGLSMLNVMYRCRCLGLREIVALVVMLYTRLNQQLSAFLQTWSNFIYCDDYARAIGITLPYETNHDSLFFPYRLQAHMRPSQECEALEW